MLSNFNPFLIFCAQILQSLIDDFKTLHTWFYLVKFLSTNYELKTRKEKGESDFSRWLMFC
jgi:hypothetical protein